MNKNLNEPLMGFDTNSKLDALQVEMMAAAPQDHFADEIVAHAEEVGAFDDGNQAIYGHYVSKMMY